MKRILPVDVAGNRWKHPLRRFVGLCCLWLFWGQVAQAQVTGTVYRDFNANGVRETPGEIGVGGVTITVYNGAGGITGTAISSTATATQGQYSIPLSTTAAASYRVQFSNLPSGYYSGPRSATVTGGATGVQFITTTGTPTSATANFGVNYPADYCQASPNYIVPCYINGNPTSTSGNVGSDASVVTLPYSVTGTAGPASETMVNSQAQVGSVFGVAYQRVSKVIFTSAFVKRHSGLGAGGAGAIYITRPTGGTTTTTSTFVTLPLAVTIASNTARGLPDSRTEANRDPLAFSLVGKTGLGDLDISEDGTELYTVNLSDRRLYKIPIVNSTTANPTAGTPVSYTLPTSVTALSGSVFRPFAVKYYRGRVYVGGINTNESVSTSTTFPAKRSSIDNPDLVVRDTTGMRAVVYEFNPTTNTFSTSAVLAYSLTFQKGATNNDKAGVDRGDRWLPWTDVLPGSTAIPSRFARNLDNNNASYPQPWLTGIEFDVDGTMILSLRDRSGDQFGNSNSAPTGTGTQLYRIIAPGDIMRAGRCVPGVNKFSIEFNASVCGGPATLGANTNQGVGNGEYYYGDAIYAGDANGPFHAEMSQGALAMLPGSGEVASIVLDPDIAYDAGGMRRFNNTTGFGNINTSVLVYVSGEAGTYGKANGLGDVDLNCNAAPIEIGNRLFFDVDRNGIQAATSVSTTALTGLTVTLFEGTTQVGSTTVASDGTYYFNNSNVNLNGATGILPGTAYQIRLPLGQAALSAYTPTTANVGSDDEIDSDATLSGTNAIINLTTGTYGQNDHSFDFGLVNCPTINTPSGSQTICAGSTISSLTLTTTATEANSIRFVYFTTPQSGTAMYTGGTASGAFTPVSGTVSTGSTAIVPTTNAGTTPLVYYAYAILDQAQFNTSCLPSAQYIITVNPIPTATATTGGSSTLTCANTTVTLNGTSTVSGSTYRWSGPGSFTSTLQNPAVSVAGTYSLTVSANNCSSTNSATVAVSQNVTTPAVSVNSLTLTCAQPTGLLTATVSGGTSPYSYQWSGPASFTNNVASVTAANTYSVIVTGANGCTAVATASVQSDAGAPNLTAANTGPLTCSLTLVTVNATSSSAGVTYRWSGPASFTSNAASFTTSTAGTYSVTATGTNGCVSLTTTTVQSNTAVPTLTANASGTLTCALTTITLSTTVTNATTPAYLWSTMETSPSIVVSNPGIYSVQVTSANGCAAATTVQVLSNAVVLCPKVSLQKR